MTKFGIQFHARNCEVIDFVKMSVINYDLYVGLSPISSQFHCAVFDKHNIDSFPMVLLGSSILYLFQSKPRMGADRDYQFSVDNPGALNIYVGIDDGNILEESHLGAISDEKTIAFWKEVTKTFKKSLLKGAWMFRPYDGAKRFDKNLYYTTQAKLAYEKGVKITQFAQSTSIFLLEKEYS